MVKRHFEQASLLSSNEVKRFSIPAINVCCATKEHWPYSIIVYYVVGLAPAQQFLTLSCASISWGRMWWNDSSMFFPAVTNVQAKTLTHPHEYFWLMYIKESLAQTESPRLSCMANQRFEIVNLPRFKSTKTFSREREPQTPAMS